MISQISMNASGIWVHVWVSALGACSVWDSTFHSYTLNWFQSPTSCLGVSILCVYIWWLIEWLHRKQYYYQYQCPCVAPLCCALVPASSCTPIAVLSVLSHYTRSLSNSHHCHVGSVLSQSLVFLFASLCGHTYSTYHVRTHRYSWFFRCTLVQVMMFAVIGRYQYRSWCP